ncbi:hypothetical protein GCM10007320_63570 [Pseudorhodoferax aquiterrae]|uniref:Uncharacterized protein n=1 Tax=Pseudorhodoferax aquiterrae TaxID=747304 RepID=A0ABQ3GGB5_9BURK|nr:hypothetical protein [Pseudorhodoferax aquiterrae]GHD03466.1 hypothetical protein GCM10007320_63570 [Pseudorhodoferax aquiterrae]
MNILVRPIRVPWRLVISVLAFGGATLLLAGLVLHQAERWSQGAAVEALRVTVRLGAHSMDQWIAERFADADVLAANTLVMQSHPAGKPDPENAVIANVQQHLDAIRRRYNYRSVRSSGMRCGLSCPDPLPAE